MTELTKKLIGFDEDLLQKLEKYAKDNKISFTVAVRTLLEKALDQDTPNESEGEGDSVDIPSLDKRLAKLEKDFSFWNADETQSKLGNIQLQVNDIEKKLNTIIAVSKKFKGHINNREIHLED